MFVALKKYCSLQAVWYPLSLFATGMIYIDYSATLKQYAPDVVVALSVILLAGRLDITGVKPLRFLLVWVVVGSIAIWLSMPAIFMLSGVGTYYMFLSIKSKKYVQTLAVALIGSVWLLQFGIYYFTILKPQIQSDYLQKCHEDFFLFLLPDTTEKITHNLYVLDAVIAAMGGKWTLSIGLHLVTLLSGIVYLFRNHTAKALLLTTPVVAVFIAAALHQFALTPRIILFMMPLMLILIGNGLHVLLSLNYKALSAILVSGAVVCIANFGAFRLCYERMDNEEITQNLNFLKSEKISGEHLYVHNLAAPAFIYYTSIHPGKNKWKELSNAHLLMWNSNYDTIGQTSTDRWALLYSWAPDEEIVNEQLTIKKSNRLVEENLVAGGHAYIYQKTPVNAADHSTAPN